MALITTGTFAGAMLDNLCARITSTARLRIYSGSAPATVAAAATGTLLVDAAMSTATPMGTSTTTSPIKSTGATSGSPATWASDSSADATGTAGYFRVTDNSGSGILQGSVGVGSGDLQLNTLSIVAADVVQITQFDVTLTGCA